MFSPVKPGFQVGIAPPRRFFNHYTASAGASPFTRHDRIRFSRPEMKVERFVPPSHAHGIALEAAGMVA